METSEGPPMEEREEEHIPEEEPTTSGRSRNNQDFLEDFEKRQENEERRVDTDDDTFHLETTDPIRLKAIDNLKRIRDEDYTVLFEKYLIDEREVRKIEANKNKYVPYESENEDVETFIELSKNISQLEKGIYTEDNLKAMYVFGDYEEEPTREIKLREKLKEYFKKYKGMFFVGVLATSLASLAIGIKEGIIKLRQYVKKKMYQQYLKEKNKFKKEVEKEINLKEEKIKEDFKKYEEKIETKSLRLVDIFLEKLQEYVFVLFVIILTILYYKYG